MTPQQEKDFKAIDRKVTKILFYIESDPSTKHMGLVEKLSVVETRVSNLEKKILKAATAFGIIGGGIVIFIKFIFTKLF